MSLNGAYLDSSSTLQDNNKFKLTQVNMLMQIEELQIENSKLRQELIKYKQLDNSITFIHSYLENEIQDIKSHQNNNVIVDHESVNKSISDF